MPIKISARQILAKVVTLGGDESKSASDLQMQLTATQPHAPRQSVPPILPKRSALTGTVPGSLMRQLYPLRFRPIFREYLWGGRKLGEVLRKPIGDGPHYAESWEVVDHGDDQSVVAHGDLAGMTLQQIVADHNEELFGNHAPQPQFPLLFKYLDAQRNLSVQVHPNDEQAAQLTPPDLGKTEAWYVVDAEPGSVVYAGLKRGYDRELFAREIARGATEIALHELEVKTGDCIFIPAGTVHAIGGGLLIAEIQQASDTTYRIFDWNRLGQDGQPRPLHVEQALPVISYDTREVAAQIPQTDNDTRIETIVQCDKFVLDRWSFDSAMSINDNRFHIISVLDSSLTITHDPAQKPLTRGETCLIPAGCEVELIPQGPCMLLNGYLP